MSKIRSRCHAPPTFERRTCDPLCHAALVAFLALQAREKHSWRNESSAAASTVRDKDEEAEAATDERDEGVQSTCCFGWIQRLQLSRGPVPGLLAAAYPSAESGDSVERA